MYIAAGVVSNRRYKKWPLYRTFFWILGIICAAFAIIGPIANRAHLDFTAHMVGHLLLGMIAPILLVLAAPISIALRTLDVQSARRLSKVLKSWPLRILSNPILASSLNIGGALDTIYDWVIWGDATECPSACISSFSRVHCGVSIHCLDDLYGPDTPSVQLHVSSYRICHFTGRP